MRNGSGKNHSVRYAQTGGEGSQRVKGIARADDHNLERRDGLRQLRHGFQQDVEPFVADNGTRVADNEILAGEVPAGKKLRGFFLCRSAVVRYGVGQEKGARAVVRPAHDFFPQCVIERAHGVGIAAVCRLVFGLFVKGIHGIVKFVELPFKVHIHKHKKARAYGYCCHSEDYRSHHLFFASK